MPLSTDPEARARQLANLRRGVPTDPTERAKATAGLGPRSDGHGAYTESALGAERERYYAELLEEFPSCSERRLIIQAQRLAQLDLLATYLDQHGVIRHKKRGEPYPAASLAERIGSAYLAEHERLEAAEREHQAHEQGTTLADVEADIARRRLLPPGQPEDS